MNTSTSLRLILATLCVFVGFTAAAGPRLRHYEPSAAVQTADLDLGSERDAQTLYERITYAARALCDANMLSFDSKRQIHRRQCVAAAVARAVDRAGAPLLTAVHLQRREQLASL